MSPHGVKRFNHLLVALALVFSIGLHWPILQSVAWLNMLVSYSHESGFEQALLKTFDGNNPCKICEFVAEGQEAETKDAKVLSIKKLEFIAAAGSFPLIAPEMGVLEIRPVPSLTPVVHPPPTPPPRPS